MPFEYEIDTEMALVTVRVTGCAETRAAMMKARELMKDQRADGTCRMLIQIDDVTTDSTPEQLRELAGVLRLLGRKFDGRKALVATDTGRLTTARIVALIASTHDDVDAFTSVDAARAWLFADGS